MTDGSKDDLALWGKWSEVWSEFISYKCKQILVGKLFKEMISRNYLSKSFYFITLYLGIFKKLLALPLKEVFLSTTHFSGHIYNFYSDNFWLSENITLSSTLTFINDKHPMLFYLSLFLCSGITDNLS